MLSRDGRQFMSQHSRLDDMPNTSNQPKLCSNFSHATSVLPPIPAVSLLLNLSSNSRANWSASHSNWHEIAFILMLMKALSSMRISWNSKNTTVGEGFFETEEGKSNAVRKGGACCIQWKRHHYCTIEHLINIVFEGMSGISMCISQHQHLNFILCNSVVMT